MNDLTLLRIFVHLVTCIFCALMLQANAVIRALGNENIIRESYSSGVDVLLSLRDLQLGAIGDLKVIVPGRRRQFILGEQETSLYCYKAIYWMPRSKQKHLYTTVEFLLCLRSVICCQFALLFFSIYY